MELGNLIYGHSRGEYEVPRGNSKGTFEWQEEFVNFLDKLGCDNYGFYYGDRTNEKCYENNRGGLSNEVFEINPYYWGDDEEEESKPNFIYYPNGFELMWYKYPLRDSYCNKEISYTEFCEMLEKCLESVRCVKNTATTTKKIAKTMRTRSLSEV